ncbi:radixin-like [Anneissia japonica]|uniref:radixin-like n=1 Tax=Anneissia japonica TaxID=1529436 RepID=UPI001425B39F|nr:radixin-like [Anneissia japonica]
MEKLTMRTEEVKTNISEEERVKAEEKTKRFQEKLQQLGSELESTQDNDKLTQEDVLHKGTTRRNSREKYRRISGRSGDTKNRVNEFENL